MRLETKQETFIVSLFSCFCLELAQLLRVAGRSGMTFVAWTVAVCFCETWNGCSREDWGRCREGTLNPETGRYSEVVVILTELCVKITWMQVFPFWLRAIIPYCISRDGWLSMETSASQS